MLGAGANFRRFTLFLGISTLILGILICLFGANYSEAKIPLVLISIYHVLCAFQEGPLSPSPSQPHPCSGTTCFTSIIGFGREICDKSNRREPLCCPWTQGWMSAKCDWPNDT